MTDKMTKTAYLLKLGNGSRWLIIATPGTRSWVEKFTTIMKLKAIEQNQQSQWPRIFFFLKGSGKDAQLEPNNLTGAKIGEDLPKNGWKSHDLRSLRFWSHRAVPDIICEIDNEGNHVLDIIRMWTSLYIIVLRVQDSGGLPLHAALIERDGKGVLLLGPAGSGKSTSCRRLPPPWSALSDDQSLAVRDDGKGYLAHPVPNWGDCLSQRSEQRCNVEHHVPLAAIFFIEQDRSDEVVPIGQEQAAVFINHSSIHVRRTIRWNLSNEAERELKKKIFNNSCQLARAIPAYILRISFNGRFWNVMEKVLQDA